jgi:parallel beta-helix repeat protein
MSKNTVYSLVLVSVLIGVLGLAFSVQRIEASGTIYIRANGLVEGTDKISNEKNATYMFTDDIHDSIVVERSNIIVDGNGHILNGSGSLMYGFNLTSVSNVTIKNVEVKAFERGISLDTSSNNTISGNNITGNSNSGIYLLFSHDNTILSNTFSSNQLACINLMTSHYNTILKNTDFSDSPYGVLLWASHRNIVSENIILSPSDQGIAMGYSDANHILNNTISNTATGIEIQQICNNSIIANNKISESEYYGIYIESQYEETRYNVILDNNITHNRIGIKITRLSGNVIYYNNFVDNTDQSSISDSTNIWNDGYPTGGNYWSDYTGVDSNHDGIGDSWYNIAENNADDYPLMGPSNSFKTTLGKYVNVISNSTVDTFRYFESNSTIMMHVSNMTVNQTRGFCRVSIPYEVMSEPFNVTIDGANPTYWNYTLYDNGTHRWIYFEYEHTTREIVIIPEFPAFLILPLFMMATLLAVIVYRRKHSL